MRISFDQLEVGEEYERVALAKLWGYQSFHAISKGVVTPRGTPFIILFITREKQESLTPYEDALENGILEMDGEEKHTTDDRLITAAERGDQIHLFYRERHHTPFTYHGQVQLLDYERRGESPSRFRFALGPEADPIERALAIEARAHGAAEESPAAPEGQLRIRESRTYERSRSNRKRAIALHGNSCVACGFNFNEYYGAELARGFIEVHHVRPVASLIGQEINLATDLVPVCSNCHSMLHARPEGLLIQELQIRINAIKD